MNSKKAATLGAKLLAAALLLYACVVIGFEAYLGVYQPDLGSPVQITTFDSGGGEHQRVVSLFESNGEYFIAANHWPRAWYRQALANPTMRVQSDGVETDYQVIPISTDDSEHDRLNAERRIPLNFRILMGFAPRRFVRLEPI